MKSTQPDQDACDARSRPCLCEASLDSCETRLVHCDGFATRCLLTVVSQVPMINFCEHFMSITSIIMSECSLRMQLFFDLLYLVVKLVPFLLCSRTVLFASAARCCIILSLLCSISTSVALREAALSSASAARFVDASAASFSAACNCYAAAIQVGS